MSFHNRFVLPIILSALAALVACGNGTGITNGVAPPTGAFNKSNLNGTYVFSVSGTDLNGDPYAIVGSFTANGSGGITGGSFDMNDSEFAGNSVAPIADSPISGSSTYIIGADGRGQATLNVTTPFGNSILLDFVLQDNSHGLVTEFDGETTGSGSGTLDLQSAGTTPTGSYAFSFSGGYANTTMVTVGNFTLSGHAATGLEDFNAGGAVYNSSGSGEAISGTVVLGPSSTPATQLVTTNYTVIYDVYAIDATHLKFIEMDSNGTLSGDAFSQTSTTIPASSTLAFTMIGGTSSTVVAAGGFMVTDSSGNFTNASSEDFNNTGTDISPEPVTFSAQSTGAGTGRFNLAFTGFTGGTEYVAYPSSGGLLLLETDDTGGVMSGAAYTQQSGATFAASQGYGLNLTGEFLGSAESGISSAEVDDIAEFTAGSSGSTVTGVIDENYAPGGTPSYGVALDGTFGSISSGRFGISATATSSNGVNSTLNGGFTLVLYAVDGTTFPFIETDSGQVATGVIVQQSATSSSAAMARSHMFLVRPLIVPHAARKKAQ